MSVFLPIAMYYGMRASVARMSGASFSIGADETCLVIVASSAVGREFSRLETSPLLQSVKRRLERSRVVLDDVLPGYVVDALLVSQNLKSRAGSGRSSMGWDSRGAGAGGMPGAAPAAEEGEEEPDEGMTIEGDGEGEGEDEQDLSSRLGRLAGGGSGGGLGGGGGGGGMGLSPNARTHSGSDRASSTSQDGGTLSAATDAVAKLGAESWRQRGLSGAAASISRFGRSFVSFGASRGTSRNQAPEVAAAAAGNGGGGGGEEAGEEGSAMGQVPGGAPLRKRAPSPRQASELGMDALRRMLGRDLSRNGSCGELALKDKGAGGSNGGEAAGKVEETAGKLGGLRRHRSTMIEGLGISRSPRVTWGGAEAAADAPRQSPTAAATEDRGARKGEGPAGRVKSGRSPAAAAAGHHQRSVASSHECVTVFVSDLVGFSTWANKAPPVKVMNTLNGLFTRLDDVILSEFPSLYKVETIGDAYVVAANLVEPDPQHAATMIWFALRAQEEASKVPRPDSELLHMDGRPVEGLQMRIGIHSGPVMSGIVGKIRRRFCMFGDTVNMGARTESSCPPGGIQLTAAAYMLAAPYLLLDAVATASGAGPSQAGHAIDLWDRGLVEVKGSDQPLHMYLAAAKIRRSIGAATAAAATVNASSAAACTASGGSDVPLHRLHGLFPRLGGAAAHAIGDGPVSPGSLVRGSLPQRGEVLPRPRSQPVSPPNAS